MRLVAWRCAHVIQRPSSKMRLMTPARASSCAFRKAGWCGGLFTGSPCGAGRPASYRPGHGTGRCSGPLSLRSSCPQTLTGKPAEIGPAHYFHPTTRVVDFEPMDYEEIRTTSDERLPLAHPGHLDFGDKTHRCIGSSPECSWHLLVTSGTPFPFALPGTAPPCDSVFARKGKDFPVNCIRWWI